MQFLADLRFECFVYCTSCLRRWLIKSSCRVHLCTMLEGKKNPTCIADLTIKTINNQPEKWIVTNVDSYVGDSC